MKRLVFGVVLLVACAGLHAQEIIIVDTSVQIPAVFDGGGSGARARGMGGAYLATGDDPAALTWNPAGLYSIDKTQMTFGVDLFTARGKSTFGPFSVPQTGSYSGPGYFSIVSPFRIKGHGFVGGLSYGRTSDEALNSAFDFGLLIDPDGPAPQYDTTLVQTSVRTVYHAYFSPVTVGFGTRLSEKIAGGFSITAMSGKSVNRLDQRTSAKDYFFPTYYPQRIQYRYDAGVIDSSKFSGVSFTFGLKYAEQKLSMAAVFKLPYTMRQTTNRTLRADTYVNGLQQTGASGVIFRDGEVFDLQIPMTLGFGGAFKPNEATTLAADFEYRAFSGRKVNRRDSVRLVPGAKSQEYFTTYDPEWRNVLVIRFGAERLLTTTNAIFPVIPIRAGIAMMPIPSPNTRTSATGVTTAVGTATSLNLSLGSGVHWSQLHLDVAYTYRSLTQKAEFESGTGEMRGKSHFLYTTFTGYF